MDVDIGNALASAASPGVSRASLDRLDERVASAHERIEAGMAAEEHGYAALCLPDRTDPDAIRAAIEPVTGRHGAAIDALVTVGIGGSSLGAATIVDALDADLETVFLDNVDPAWVETQLSSLSLDRTAIVVVSQSGTTAETLANFLVVREAFETAGVDWTDRTIVVTGDAGPLRELADRHDLPALDVPAGVPGRFSALSSMGLIAAIAADLDVEALLDGAAAEAASLTGSLFECPAYAYGATAHSLAARGTAVNAFMPYAESLETAAEWFAQLWAESLGKDGLGQTPVRALGATDQHSQLQLYRAGPRNAMVTFVTPRERPDLPIPPTDVEALAYLGDGSLGDLIDAEFRATEASLAASNRPSVRIELARVDAHELGGLLYGLEAATVLAGELAGVNTFDQPAVDWGKRAARGLLGGEDVPEADAVGSKTTLRVER